MTSIASSSVSIQTSSHSVPAMPPWFGEVALLIHHLRQQKVLETIAEQVRFARRRFGHFEMIDFVAVLFGYALSGERTLAVFYERLRPWATAFMALFERDRLPSRSALSRWLAALDQATVEALRTRFRLRSARAPTDQRGPSGWLVGSLWHAVAGLRGRRHARGRPATRLAANLRSSSGSAPLAPALCPRLLGAQARRGRADTHDRLAGPYPPVA